MSKSIVVELWDRHKGVVGIYRVGMVRTFWQMMSGTWSVSEVHPIEGEDSDPIRDTIRSMVDHTITEMNGWLLRRL